MRRVRDFASYHAQSLTDGKLPMWRHGRAWAFGWGWEWSLFHNSRLWQASVGWPHFSVYLGWFAFSLIRSNDDRFERPEFSVCFGHGGVSFEHPWVRLDEWRARDPWWRKRIRLELVDWVLGRSRCTTEEEPLGDVVIPMPEGCYPAKATRETRTWRRRFGITKTRESVWLDIDGCIPYSGKGENSWDCGDDGLCGIGGDTLEKAIGNAVASALKSRRRYGLDSKSTGAKPVMAEAP